MKVYLDPGHGGYDPGASANGIQEKDIALTVAKRTAHLLLDSGFDVRLSRTTDELAGGDHLSTGASLAWRADDANNWGADVFVSIHCNSGGGKGFESYRHDSIDHPSPLQESVHDAIYGRIADYAEWDLEDRGMKSANFAVLRETAMPAVLTENLFVDHDGSADLLKQSDFLDLLAEGHAVGIARLRGEDIMPSADEIAEATVRKLLNRDVIDRPGEHPDNEEWKVKYALEGIWRQSTFARQDARMARIIAASNRKALKAMAESLPDDVRAAVHSALDENVEVSGNIDVTIGSHPEAGEGS